MNGHDAIDDPRILAAIPVIRSALHPGGNFTHEEALRWVLSILQKSEWPKR